MELIDLHEVLYSIAVQGVETDFLKIKNILRDMDKGVNSFDYYERQTAIVVAMLKELLYIADIEEGKWSTERYRITGYGYEDAYNNRQKYGKGHRK